MQGWHTTFLGMRGLPRDISDFEMKAFFTFDGAERDAINARRGDSHKLGLALHIGFLRMSGRLLGPGGHPKCPTYGHPNCSTLATVI